MVWRFICTNTDVLNPDGEFTKIDQILPLNKSQSPDDRAREIEGFMDWCRNNNLKPFVDDRSETPEKMGFLPVLTLKCYGELTFWLENFQMIFFFSTNVYPIFELGGAFSPHWKDPMEESKCKTIKSQFYGGQLERAIRKMWGFQCNLL